MTTKQTILQAALDLASTPPGRYDRLTRSEIAKRANCATGSINYYFTDMAGLRDATVEGATERFFFLQFGRGEGMDKYLRLVPGMEEAIFDATVARWDGWEETPPAPTHRVVAAAIMDGHPAVSGLSGAERAEALAGL